MPPFDPNAAAVPGSGIFGLPFDEHESALVLIPVPWEATTSYRAGTANGPAAILEASHQVDLGHRRVVRPYEAGIHMLPISEEVRAWSDAARALAVPILENGGSTAGEPQLEENQRRVNAASVRVNDWVRAQVQRQLAAGRIPALVGGEHSTPFGAIEALAQHHGGIDVLQIDAHSDTREAFEGFDFSHASIMHNVLTRIPAVRRLVQVGIRDFCEEELAFNAAQGKRVATFFDEDLAAARFRGEQWHDTIARIVAALDRQVFISVDIDGFDPKLCPNTGTPVAGGLEYQQVLALIEAVARSGRRIVGFDLNEVAPDPNGANDWDANVGARLLYQLCAWTLASHGRAALAP